MEKIAEVLYNAYDKKFCKIDLSPEGWSDKFKELCQTLSEKQKDLLFVLDRLNMELLTNHEKSAIQFMLELIEPELVD